VSETKELQNLIKGCLKGDRRAQQAVYRKYYGKMKAVCMRYTRDADQASDVLQEGFLKVFMQIDRFTGVGSFEGWIRRIMVNLSIDRFRRLKHDFLATGELIDSEKTGVADEEPDDHEDDYLDITPEQIIDAMQQLTPAYRTVFNLFVFEDYTHQDIAEALQISVGTSKSNYAKAKKNIRRLLEKQLGLNGNVQRSKK
jgi:RNA polymerase sigma-70 factor (ECF subfamily)